MFIRLQAYYEEYRFSPGKGHIVTANDVNILMCSARILGSPGIFLFTAAFESTAAFFLSLDTQIKQ